ncbi:glycoside hydrolase family 3 N-terminal domain-containing protein [Gaetbulibacter aestuarii]|uniref:beta-glucosidase n=1 Tax=Gaetbulibacter aestuarii TaxID=1502358 RepID=A0ABW7MZG3_9FLAO
MKYNLNSRNTLLYLIVFVLFAACKQDNTSVSNNGEPLYLDASAKIEDRVNDLMARMTLEDKVAQMSQYVGLEHMRKAMKNLKADELDKNDAQGFYPGYSIQDIADMAAEGKIGSFLHVVTAEEANELQKLAQKSPLKIPLLIGIDAIHGNGLYNGATIYPSPITQAATWDDALLKEASKQTALEMRATGSHWAFTPNIDVLRDPRWGRTGETFGEDPYLVGKMGLATIQGLQSDDFESGTYLPNHVIACAKHLIGGGESLNGLNASPLDVSKRTLFEIFLPPYKEAVREGNLFSIMLSHNEVNGVPAHMDKFLMTDVMRDRWGFNGFYVSDWNDVSRIANWHHIAKDYKEASLLSVAAGLDMNMHGPKFADYVIQLVKEGKLPQERIDEACSKILEAKFRLGLFENPFVEVGKENEVVFNKTHQETSLKQAREAITLLKNNGILPLKGSNKSIFVTGPNANNETIMGDWVYEQPAENTTTVYEGIKALGEKNGFKVDYFNAGERSRKMKDSDIDKAATLAKQYDMTILVLGENSFRYDWPNKTTGENIDRATLELSGKQMALANKILANGKPVIVVYVSGSPIAEPELENQANAVIYAYEPGSFGGQAVAETIFGALNPGGKLPVTIPRSVGQLQMVYNHKPTMYIHKYNTEEKVPLHPFGFGLSYTTFKISEPRLSQETFSSINDTIQVSVDVTNTGEMAGDEIVQMYIRDNISSFTRPVKELKGYKRVHLEPGETTTVTLPITANCLAFYDADFNFVVEPGEFTVMTGDSSADKDLKKVTFEATETINLKE